MILPLMLKMVIVYLLAPFLTLQLALAVALYLALILSLTVPLTLASDLALIPVQASDLALIPMITATHSSQNCGHCDWRYPPSPSTPCHNLPPVTIYLLALSPSTPHLVIHLVLSCFVSCCFIVVLILMET